MWWVLSVPLVQIELTDMQKMGKSGAPPTPLVPTPSGHFCQLISVFSAFSKVVLSQFARMNFCTFLKFNRMHYLCQFIFKNT